MFNGALSELGGGIVRAEQALSSGWGLNMILVRLPGGGTLVHSPTWLGDATFDLVESVGRPAVLFAPNHFHHLGLPRFRERYPDALVVAPRDAHPRLQGKGHRDLADIDAAIPLLPKGARFLRCEGARTGEAWLSVPGEGGGRPTWLVCDAFFNVNRPLRGATGAALRLLGTGPGLCIGQTFVWVALRDRRHYRAWTLEVLADARPARLVVSHGDPIDLTDPSPIEALLESRV